jgi:hypothetical protein
MPMIHPGELAYPDLVGVVSRLSTWPEYRTRHPRLGRHRC